MQAGINLEFARTEGFDFEEGLRKAREAGYEYTEAYAYSPIFIAVNSHLSVVTTTDYHHMNTDEADPARINALLAELGLRFSTLDVHSCLLLPQVGVPYLCKAIDLAAEVGSPIVMSDEGPLDEGWLSLDDAFDIFCISLEALIAHARPKGVKIAVEQHNALTTRAEFLEKLLDRFSPDDLGINFDSGNSFLAGNDPVEMLRPIADRVIHVHAKQIPESQVHLRGHVTGIRVGVGIGEGVIDFDGIISVLADAGYEGVVSMECDTFAQAQESLPRLNELFAKYGS